MNRERQYQFIRNIHRLLNKGYTLLAALDILEYHYSKEVIFIKGELEKGNTLSQVFRKMKFLRFVCDTIQIGENSNKLNDMIELVNKHFTFYRNIKKLFTKFLLYPLVLMIFALFAFEVIRINLYPVINVMLKDYSVKQNDIIIFITFHMLKIIFFIFLFSIIIFSVDKRLANIIPLIKDYRSLVVMKYLEVLIISGNSLEEALFFLQRNLNYQTYRITDLEKRLIYKIKLSPFTPYKKVFINQILLGMKSNNLIKSIQDYSEFNEDLLFDKLTRVTYYIQFSLFLLLSINIFLIYYIVLIPLFNITNNL
ncbi:MAG TPA: type II secretion system F family protein [Haloplasmataceae bacterium]